MPIKKTSKKPKAQAEPEKGYKYTKTGEYAPKNSRRGTRFGVLEYTDRNGEDKTDVIISPTTITADHNVFLVMDKATDKPAKIVIPYNQTKRFLRELESAILLAKQKAKNTD